MQLQHLYIKLKPYCCREFIILLNGFISVPTEPPTNIEAVLLNSSAVHLKWKPPLQYALNGVLKSYQVIFLPLLLKPKYYY